MTRPTTRSTKPAPMCFINIGFINVLMPADKGLKLVELLQHALECDQEYAHRGYLYIPRSESLRVELRMVPAAQIRMPKPDPQQPRGPLLLERGT